MAILFYGTEPFEQTVKYTFDRRPHVKSGGNWASGFREEYLRITQFNTCIPPRARVDNPRGLYFDL